MSRPWRRPALFRVHLPKAVRPSTTSRWGPAGSCTSIDRVAVAWHDNAGSLRCTRWNAAPSSAARAMSGTDAPGHDRRRDFDGHRRLPDRAGRCNRCGVAPHLAQVYTFPVATGLALGDQRPAQCRRTHHRRPTAVRPCQRAKPAEFWWETGHSKWYRSPSPCPAAMRWATILCCKISSRT
jgi:hypothetical protein